MSDTTRTLHSLTVPGMAAVAIAGGLACAAGAAATGRPAGLIVAALYLGAILAPVLAVATLATLDGHRAGLARVRADQAAPAPSDRLEVLAAPPVLYGRGAYADGTCSHGVPWSGTCYSCRVRV